MTDHTGLTFIPSDRHDTYPAIDPTKSDLSGRVILLTGASKGIGKAIALAMAQSGARGLVLLARSDLEAVKASCLAAQRPGHPLQVLALSVDVTNNEQVLDAAKQVQTTFGRIDVVINNAGYMEKHNLIADTDVDEWWSVWNINMRGTYQVTRAFLPLLIESGGEKTIINLTSVGAHFFVPRYSAYPTSKLALLRFAEFVDLEYSDKGILTYSVHPGAIASDMAATMPQEMMHVLIDTPEVAAHTILWLIQERREWLAGRYVSCQWDVDALLAKKQEIVDGDKLKVRMVV